MGGKYLLHISRCLLSFIHVHYPSSGNIYQPNNESPRGTRQGYLLMEPCNLQTWASRDA
jgi:hypothetical protein